jgi:hypothetical protein
MKKLILILLFVSASFAATGFTWNWNINLGGDTATVTKWKANNDSVLNWSFRISDTINTKPNFTKVYRNHDSVYSYIRIDTIRNSPNIDTIIAKPLYIKGRAVIDTVAGTQASATIAVFDSINTRSIRTTANGTFDSIYTRALSGAISGGNISADSVFANKFGFSGSFPCSLSGCTTIPTGTAYFNKIGNVVTILFPTLLGTSNTNACQINGLPSYLQPFTQTDVAVRLIDSAGIVIGSIAFQTASYCILLPNAGAWPTSGYKGFPNAMPYTSITYYCKR